MLFLFVNNNPTTTYFCHSKYDLFFIFKMEKKKKKEKKGLVLWIYSWNLEHNQKLKNCIVYAYGYWMKLSHNKIWQQVL